MKEQKTKRKTEQKGKMEGVASESKRKEKKGAKETKSWKIERGFGSRKIRGERRKRDEGGGWNLGKIAKKNTEKGKKKPRKGNDLNFFGGETERASVRKK